MERRLISVVAPVYNEVELIGQFVAVVRGVLETLPYEYELVLVDDGATDGTREALDQIQAAAPNSTTVVHFSRNFGHQAALTAGMDYATGDAVVCLDADLQHPPEVIRELVRKWEEGFDIVKAVRRQDAEVGWFKPVTARLFYALINGLSATRVEPNGADFRLISRRVADVFRRDIRERDRFLRGLVGWVGFRSTTVEFEARARTAGTSKYPLLKMLAFARTGIISFSKVPLKIASVLGFLISSLSALYAVYAVIAYFFFNRMVVPGWASILFVTTFLGGCQLLFLGLIGEYIATIFDEIKARPLYLIDRVIPRSGARTPTPCASAVSGAGR